MSLDEVIFRMGSGSRLRKESLESEWVEKERLEK
jgi:hypothetical protein